MRLRSASIRRWADMAPDILANIFARLSMKQRLLDIPCVCKPWKLASQSPLCWQILFFEFHKNVTTPRLLELLLQRCQGCLQEITLPGCLDRQCLDLLAPSAPLLQKLEISGSGANDKWASYAAPLMPLLTYLDLSFCNISHLALEAFGKSCKGITKLARNRYAYWNDHTDNSEAFAIAQHYPSLRHLELQCNLLSVGGLRAILDNCAVLEYLDTRGCSHVDAEDETLLKICRSRLKYFREPDTTDDDSYYIDEEEEEVYYIDSEENE